MHNIPAGMNIGVPKEIKPDEYRVALTPAGALELNRRGHSVLVEQGAGEGSAFRDADYESVGARIGTVGQVWGESELVRRPLADVAAHLEELEDAKTLAGLLLLLRGRE